MDKNISIGDPVEVKFATHDGPIWNPATVVAVLPHEITVAYADGRRQALLRGEGMFRVSKNTQPMKATHQPSPDKTTRG